MKYYLLLLSFALSLYTFGQIIVGQYTGIDFATNYTNPQQGAGCGNIAGINTSIGDADFVNGSAEVPLGWQFEGTWDSGNTYYDGAGAEVLLVSLHTYTEAWHVALKLSDGSTTAFQDYYLTIVTTNATGSLNHCGGVVNNFDYERPSQELDFASYTIPPGEGVIGIIFEPFDDGAGNPDPHGVLILEGTPFEEPCDYSETFTSSICGGDSLLFQGDYFNQTGIYYDSLQTWDGCDSVLIMDLTVMPKIEVFENETICSGDSILLGGEFQYEAGIYMDSLTSALGCDSIIITTLNVDATPQAIIKANPDIGCKPIDVTLLNNSIDGQNFFWDLGDGSTYSTNTTESIDMTYGDTTTIVSLIAYNNLCSDTTEIVITLNTCGCMDPLAENYDPEANIDDGSCEYLLPAVVFPNIFTPNDDGENDLYYPTTFNTKSVRVVIINRWGELMYEEEWDPTTNSLHGWDGKDKSGTPASEGVYNYMYFVTGIKGDEIEGHGFLHLVRE